jgi:hypothetical protein
LFQHNVLLILMRNKLKKDTGVRKRFTGVFVKTGKKINFKGYSEDTLLLKNIVDVESKEVVADHVWFTYTKGFDALGTLGEGVRLEFDARIKEYTKGYVNKALGINNQKHDYKLSNPTKIKLSMKEK